MSALVPSATGTAVTVMVSLLTAKGWKALGQAPVLYSTATMPMRGVRVARLSSRLLLVVAMVDFFSSGMWCDRSRRARWMCSVSSAVVQKVAAASSRTIWSLAMMVASEVGTWPSGYGAVLPARVLGETRISVAERM